MRHLKSGRKLGVSPSHRKALLRQLTLALIERDQIKTTPARAKAVRHLAERVVTLAKKDTLAARRLIVRHLGSTETKVIGKNRVRLALRKLTDDIGPRFKNQAGGYTQIVRTDRRIGDNAETCFMRYLPQASTGKKAVKAAPSDKGAAKKAPAKKVAKKKTAKKTAAKK